MSSGNPSYSVPVTGVGSLYQNAIQRYFSDLEAHPNTPDPLTRFREEIRRLDEDLERGLVRPRRVLVIGGAGFIGSVLTRRLLERGHHVRVLDALLYDHASTLEGLAGDPRFEFIQGDILDYAVLHQSLEEVTDVVLLAALVGDPICKKYPEQAKQTNFEGAVGVMDALQNYPINKFVFTSTCSNYGIFQGASAADEQAPLSPLSIYAETKVEVERYIAGKKGTVEFSPTVLRLATAFGTGYRPRFDLTVNHFAKDLALGKPLVVYDQTTWRPYCHIEDISDAIIRVLEYPRDLVEFEVFNVGGNSMNHSKEQIVDLVRQSVPDAKVEYQAGGSDPRDYQVDFSKIQRVLEFSPIHTTAGHIQELVGLVREGRFSDVDDRPLFYGNHSIPRFDTVP